MRLNLATRITIFRILLTIPFVACMLKINDARLSQAMRDAARYASVVIFLVMAASDALDGYLARKNKQVTKLGTFLDPLADKMLIGSACLLLSSPNRGIEGFLLPPTVMVLIIGKELFVLIGFVIVYFITSQIYIAPVLIGKIANDLQLSMIAAILLSPEISSVVPGWIWVCLLYTSPSPRD